MNKAKKLVLHRETVVLMDAHELQGAAGGKTASANCPSLIATCSCSGCSQ